MGKGGSKAQSLPPVVTFGSPAKHSPAVQELQETPFQSLVQEDSPGGEKGNPLQYSCLERIPWTEEPWNHL